jgi:hypothetical protein
MKKAIRETIYHLKWVVCVNKARIEENSFDAVKISVQNKQKNNNENT